MLKVGKKYIVRTLQDFEKDGRCEITHEFYGSYYVNSYSESVTHMNSEMTRLKTVTIKNFRKSLKGDMIYDVFENYWNWQEWMLKENRLIMETE